MRGYTLSSITINTLSSSNIGITAFTRIYSFNKPDYKANRQFFLYHIFCDLSRSTWRKLWDFANPLLDVTLCL